MTRKQIERAANVLALREYHTRLKCLKKFEQKWCISVARAILATQPPRQDRLIEEVEKSLGAEGIKIIPSHGGFDVGRRLCITKYHGETLRDALRKFVAAAKGKEVSSIDLETS